MLDHTVLTIQGSSCKEKQAKTQLIKAKQLNKMQPHLRQALNKGKM